MEIEDFIEKQLNELDTEIYKLSTRLKELEKKREKLGTVLELLDETDTAIEVECEPEPSQESLGRMFSKKPPKEKKTYIHRDERLRQILRFLSQTNGTGELIWRSRPEIEEALGMSKTRLHDLLVILIDNGRVERQGQSWKTRYRLIPVVKNTRKKDSEIVWP